MAQNLALPLSTVQRPQSHDFYDIGADLLGASLNKIIPVDISATFPVKEIRFTLAYTAQTTASPDLFLFRTLSMPQVVPDGPFIAVINTPKLINTNTVTYSQGFEEGHTMRYLFRDAKDLRGSWDLQIESANAASITTASALLHIECLG